MGAKFEAIKHATNTGIMWHCENNLEQGSRIQVTIKKLLEDADSPDFIQCSRSTIVNRRYINNVDFSNRIIHLKDGMGRVDIGITFKNSLKEMFR